MHASLKSALLKLIVLISIEKCETNSLKTRQSQHQLNDDDDGQTNLLADNSVELANDDMLELFFSAANDGVRIVDTFVCLAAWTNIRHGSFLN